MPDDTNEFTGVVRVASTIVDYLSSGLYKSPGACLKELINNSYDADASKVTVLVKPDADQIIISDDGIGFTKAQFQTHFNHVIEES
jgi:HSP90 family molecular chaperone